jgi:hypothetical protein
MTFRQFVAKRFGAWPNKNDPAPEGYQDWFTALFIALADWSDQEHGSGGWPV